MTETTERVVQYIKEYGPQRGRHIARDLGLTLRSVGLAVREARLSGTPICSDSSRGYYCGDPSRTIADIKSRIRAMAELLGPLDRATASRVQLALNLDGQP